MYKLTSTHTEKMRHGEQGRFLGKPRKSPCPVVSVCVDLSLLPGLDEEVEHEYSEIAIVERPFRQL